MRHVFELLLIFVFALFITQLSENYNTPNNINNPIPPSNNNNDSDPLKKYEEAECSKWRGYDPSYCTRFGLWPTENNSFVLTLTRNITRSSFVKFENGCFSEHSHSQRGNETITLKKNPLIDKTINWIKITHPKDNYLQVTIEKKRTKDGIPFCTFRASTSLSVFSSDTESYFYVYGNDVNATVVLKK